MRGVSEQVISVHNWTRSPGLLRHHPTQGWRSCSIYPPTPVPHWLRAACHSCVLCLVTQSCETPWTVARQAPLPMGFSRQEYWSRFPCPSPGDLPNPGIEPRSPSLQADSLLSEPPGKPSYSSNSLSSPTHLVWEPSFLLWIDKALTQSPGTCTKKPTA